MRHSHSTWFRIVLVTAIVAHLGYFAQWATLTILNDGGLFCLKRTLLIDFNSIA